jgi:hypothetical protein
MGHDDAERAAVEYRVASQNCPAGTRTIGAIPAPSAATEICTAMSRSIELCSRSRNSQSSPQAFMMGFIYLTPLPRDSAFCTHSTVTASKGVMRMRSQIVTGLAGVSSPTFYTGTTAAVAVSIPPGTQDATIVSEFCATGDAWRLDRRYR